MKNRSILSWAMSKTGIVILGAGLLQLPVIVTAKKRGWFVISADQNSQAPGVADSDVFLQVSTRDTSGLINKLRDFRNQFQYCATLGTDMTASVAAINEVFGLSGLTVRQAAVTTHKGKMRKFLSLTGLLQPKYLVTNNRETALSWAKEARLESGFVIKPSHNMGARGVMFLQKPEDLSFAFEYAMSESQDGEIIIEEYIPADEISVDALCIKGKVYITGLADRNIELKDGRYFIETGHTMPTQRHPDKFLKIEGELSRVALALGELENSVYTGALKGDIRITPAGEVVIGEIATRLSGGFMSTHTYPLSTGNDLLAGYLDILENKEPAFILQGKNNSYENVTIERAFLATPGRVEVIKVPESPQQSADGIRSIFIHYKPGDRIESLQSNVGKPVNVIISGKTLAEAEQRIEKLRDSSEIRVVLNSLTRKEINVLARKKFNKNFCHVCRVCDGVHCASGVPGMGGVDSMRSFRDNIASLAEISINYLQTKINTVDTSSHFMNRDIPFPVLNGPITGSVSNMGGSITEYDYAVEVSSAMKELGLPALFGDGADPLKYHTALEGIRQSGGGYLVVKPRVNNQDIIRRILDAEQAGAEGWGMDIDAVNIKTMLNKGQQTVKKTAKDILEISRNSRLPFFIKGIMDNEEAFQMADAGARAILVGNHGGRINDNLPGTARVLEKITEAMKARYPGVQIYADGGIRSGEDVFKMLALGADGVIVGRPLIIATVAAGKLGAYSVLKTFSGELREVMQKTGITCLAEISNQFIKK